MPLLDPTFVANSNPAANAASSATNAAVTGKSHTCQTIHCTLTSNASLAAVSAISLVLRDGATGVGSVLWSSSLSLPNVAGSGAAPVEVSGLAIQGTVGNAMTLEATAAGGAGTFETCAFTGFMT